MQTAESLATAFWLYSSRHLTADVSVSSRSFSVFCSIIYKRSRSAFLFPSYMIFFFHRATVHSGPEPPRCRGLTIPLRHTTLGRTPLDEWSARRRELHLTTRITHKRPISMSPVGIEPAIPATERPHTHSLERPATGICCSYVIGLQNYQLYDAWATIALSV